MEKRGVYGENHPAEDDHPEPDIREQIVDQEERKEGTSEQMDGVRREQIERGQDSGGMGRKETPKDGEQESEPESEDDEELTGQIPG